MRSLNVFITLTLFLLSGKPVFAQAQERVHNPPAAGQAPADPAPRLEGTPQTFDSDISLNLKGMDIIDVLKMFSPYGMNIVIGKNVSGRVTLFLKNVNVMDAFEIILLANDLTYEKKGGIIYVMTQRDYETAYGQRSDEKKKARVIQLKHARATELSQALNQIKSNVGKVVVDAASNTLALVDIPERVADMEEFIRTTDIPTETVVYDLNFAQAEKLQAKVQDILTKNVGSVRVDERTNKIAITDYPEKHAEVARIISAFDEKSLQVLIDAQILELNPKKEFKMGVDWDYWIKKNVRLVASLPNQGAVNRLSIGTAASGESVTQPEQYKGIIDALQTIGDLKILSSPRIMAVNNQEARILVGTRQPYAQQTTVTGDGGVVTTSETINYVDVGIKLYVTPTINRDGYITMKIRPEVSSAGTPLVTAKGEQIPVVSTSEAETSVMVKDGVTVIIGGLTKQQTDRTISQIPILGSIPVLGHLFKRTSSLLEKNELVILLTPHLMTGESYFGDFSGIKARDGARMDMRGTELVTERQSNPVSAVDFLSISTPMDYYNFVVGQVKARALFDGLKVKGTVKISFSLLSNGNLADEPLVESSSDTALDLPAIRAIKDSAPFPVFPRSINKDKEDFKAELVFE